MPVPARLPPRLRATSAPRLAPPRRVARVRATAPAIPSPPAPAITLTPSALAQCRALAAKRGDGAAQLVLRVGVKSGGCNGMR